MKNILRQIAIVVYYTNATITLLSGILVLMLVFLKWPMLNSNNFAITKFIWHYSLLFFIILEMQVIQEYLFPVWIPISSNNLANENETVWLISTTHKTAYLGCLVHVKNEGWFWALSNGTLYAENGEIITEAEISDHEHLTHYARIPKLPW